MGKFSTAVIGTCLALGTFSIQATLLGVPEAKAAKHGVNAIHQSKSFDGFRAARSGDGRRAHSILTLPGNPRAAATNRISRHLKTNAGGKVAGQIGWFINDARGAYRKALAEGKPLVLVFATPDCGFCQKLLTEVLPCNSVNRLAGRAVFAYSEPMSDKIAGQIAAELHVTQAPTISVIDPKTRSFEERARITGYFSATQVSGDLEKFLSVETSHNGSVMTLVPASADAVGFEPNSCAR